MTREEMRSRLLDLAILASARPVTAQDLLDCRINDIYAALSSCVCEGREPIWDGCAEIFDVRGDRCQADAGAIVFRAKGIKEGQSLFLLAFLPAEELP